MKFGDKIGAYSLGWKRAIHRVFFFAAERFLADRVLQKAEKSLLFRSRQDGIPLVAVGESGLLRFYDQEFTVEKFADYIDNWRPVGEFILLVKPGAFHQEAVARGARSLWVRSRTLGIPAFAVCDAGADPLWQEFGADAFTRFYIFSVNQVFSPALIVQNDHLRSFVVNVDPAMIAVCQEVVI